MKYQGRQLLHASLLVLGVFLSGVGMYAAARTHDSGLAFGSIALLFGCVVAVVFEAAKDRPES
jgi:FtsH-binding integral membrane protein